MTRLYPFRNPGSFKDDGLYWGTVAPNNGFLFAKLPDFMRAARQIPDVYREQMVLLTFQFGLGMHRVLSPSVILKGNVGRQKCDAYKIIRNFFICFGMRQWSNSLPIVNLDYTYAQ